MRLVHIAALAFLLTGCSHLQRSVPTMLELARQLCVLSATENPPSGIDAGEVALEAAEQYCQHESRIRPFLQQLAGARVAASRQVGIPVQDDGP